MSRPYRAKIRIGAVPVALPRAGMFSPYRAGRAVAMAMGFATTEWTQRSG